VIFRQASKNRHCLGGHGAAIRCGPVGCNDLICFPCPIIPSKISRSVRPCNAIHATSAATPNLERLIGYIQDAQIGCVRGRRSTTNMLVSSAVTFRATRQPVKLNDSPSPNYEARYQDRRQEPRPQGYHAIITVGIEYWSTFVQLVRIWSCLTRPEYRTNPATPQRGRRSADAFLLLDDDGPLIRSCLLQITNLLLTGRQLRYGKSGCQQRCGQPSLKAPTQRFYSTAPASPAQPSTNPSAARCNAAAEARMCWPSFCNQ
jgi:hypothetical protein